MPEPVFYDLSGLHARGNHFVAISFALPYCLHLPDETYRVQLPTGVGPILAQIVLDKKGYLMGTERPQGHINKGERLGILGDRSRYTFVHVYMPIGADDPRKNSNRELVWQQAERNKLFFRDNALVAINRLLLLYREVSNDHHVRPLSGRETWFDFWIALAFNTRPPEDLVSEFTMIALPVQDYHDIVPELPDLPPQLLSVLRDRLLTEYEVPLAASLIQNAQEFLEQGLFRQAVLEAETAFEAALFRAFKEYAADKPLKTTFESPVNLIKYKPFQAMLKSLNKEFPYKGERYNRWHTEVWSLRGDIIHGKRGEVAGQEASNAVTMVIELLDYLFDRWPPYVAQA